VCIYGVCVVCMCGVGNGVCMCVFFAICVLGVVCVWCVSV